MQHTDLRDLKINLCSSGKAKLLRLKGKAPVCNRSERFLTKLYAKDLLPDHHHSTATTSSPCAIHWVKLFIKGICEADHKISSQIIIRHLLQIIRCGSLGYAHTIVQNIVYRKSQFTCFILQ